jgi:F420-dependent methylenetetrahydromethanopterin dehydrogenase
VPTPPNAGVLPEEVVGELRIVAMRAHSSTAVVTQSTREIEKSDDAVARKGY